MLGAHSRGGWSTMSAIELSPGIDPWDQQPRESTKRYERFLTYRDLGRMRSLTTVNKLLTERGDKLTYGTLRVIAATNRWAERAQKYDQHLSNEDNKRLEQARRDMQDRHLKIAAALTRKALESLRQLAELTPRDITQYLRLAADLEVRALGEPSHTIAVTGPGGGPIISEDFTGLTPEERRARLRDVVSELARRSGLHIEEKANTDGETSTSV